tara:strand:+ start:9655 stop:10041 length:387 start_codon:yes stop_codon:yes gene_type:complete
MAEIKLFNRTETIVRTTGKGYINDDEEWVSGTTITVPVECNIQPYREGKNSFNSPTGFRTIDAIKVYVPEEFGLITADEIDGIIGDQLTYEGKEYFCKDLERWTVQTSDSISLVPAHNLGYFYRKDKI